MLRNLWLIPLWPLLGSLINGALAPASVRD